MKKILAGLVCAAMMVSLMITPALACSSDYQKVQKKVDSANVKIMEVVRHAQATAKDDRAWMHSKIDKIVADTIKFANRYGYTLQCEYTYEFVDGYWEMIDPLMVVNIGS